MKILSYKWTIFFISLIKNSRKCSFFSGQLYNCFKNMRNCIFFKMVCTSLQSSSNQPLTTLKMNSQNFHTHRGVTKLKKNLFGKNKHAKFNENAQWKTSHFLSSSKRNQVMLLRTQCISHTLKKRGKMKCQKIFVISPRKVAVCAHQKVRSN